MCKIRLDSLKNTSVTDILIPTVFISRGLSVSQKIHNTVILPCTLKASVLRVPVCMCPQNFSCCNHTVLVEIVFPSHNNPNKSLPKNWSSHWCGQAFHYWKRVSNQEWQFSVLRKAGHIPGQCNWREDRPSNELKGWKEEKMAGTHQHISSILLYRSIRNFKS